MTTRFALPFLTALDQFQPLAVSANGAARLFSTIYSRRHPAALSAARVLARDGYDGDRMFEVDDRRMPSGPGWAGWYEGRSAVSVMT